MTGWNNVLHMVLYVRLLSLDFMFTVSLSRSFALSCFRRWFGGRWFGVSIASLACYSAELFSPLFSVWLCISIMLKIRL
jgi:hypothetical protein